MLRELDPLPVSHDRRTYERRAEAIDEVGAAGDLDRRACTAMDDTDRVQRAISRMDARKREPVIASDLPGNRRQRERGG